MARLLVVGYILVHVGTLRRALTSSGSLGFAWVHSGAPNDRPIHSGSRRFTQALISFVWFIRFRVVYA